mmetsp:Transcript_26787/g.86470  ORF Transcript_26787/g.86470 Transcript_26787/m.86470 type:complete len:656 (+) Transcript_26787:3814-5781(+)
MCRIWGKYRIILFLTGNGRTTGGQPMANVGWQSLAAEAELRWPTPGPLGGAPPDVLMLDEDGHTLQREGGAVLHMPSGTPGMFHVDMLLPPPPAPSGLHPGARPASPSSVEKMASLLRSISFVAGRPRTGSAAEEASRIQAYDTVAWNLRNELGSESIGRMAQVAPHLVSTLEAALLSSAGVLLGAEGAPRAFEWARDSLDALRSLLPTAEVESVLPGQYYREILEADVAQLSQAVATAGRELERRLAIRTDVLAVIARPASGAAELAGVSKVASQAGLHPEAAAAAQAAEVAALRTRLTSFACSELGQAHHSGRLDGHHGASGGTVSFSASPAKGRQTGACDELVAACRALLDVCRQAGAAHQERALLDSLVGLWADAPAASPVRMPLLCLLEDALLGSADVGPGASGGSRAGAGPGGGSGDADVLATWARSLPKLLWQLHDRQPQLSCALLRSLRRLADSSVGSARAELLSSVQPSLEPFFCSRGRDGRPPILGPFLALPPPARRLALHTSLRSAPISPRLLAAIARCALAGAAAPALRRAALEIVGAVEAAGHCHALSLQSRVSFYATLLRETAAAAQAAGGTASQPHGPEAHPPVGQAAETINESGVGEGSLTLAEFRAKTLEALRRAEVQGGAVVTEAVARFAWAPATLS